MKIDILKGLENGSIKDVRISTKVLSVKADSNELKHYKIVELTAEVEDDAPVEDKTEKKRGRPARS